MFLVCLNLIKKIVSTTMCIIFFNICNLFAQIPNNCGCDDTYDPITQPNELAMCLSDCDDADIPINGNIWILLLAGTGLFIARQRLLRSKLS